ncbi:hypothetical protein AFEL58S_02072 [Afipia felis]
MNILAFDFDQVLLVRVAMIATGLAVLGIIFVVVRAADRRRIRLSPDDPMMLPHGDQPGFTPEQHRHFRRQIAGGAL